MDKKSILLSDVSVQGDLVEKEKIIVDGKVNGDISAEEIETHKNSMVKGNLSAKKISVGGKIRGNLDSDTIKIIDTGDIEGVLNQN